VNYKQIALAEVILKLDDKDLANKFDTFLENYDEIVNWVKIEKQ